MGAIIFIGINFVRTQWIALAVMCAYVLGIGGVYRVHTQPDEILFFLRWHAGYAIFCAAMIAIPALQTERKTRRILAVLSKGIHRWQYLGGLLLGCAMISALLCVLIGGTAAWLGQQAGISTDGLPEIMLLLFCCCVFAASTGLFFATFFHPLLAMAATSAVLALPLVLIQVGWPVAWVFFPVGALFRTLWTSFHFRSLGNSLNTLILSAIVQTLTFWIAAAIVFARRDVTISPE
jgi:ABC-type transport system involved in multi-copper enzyme maturation permease subunit